jgi:N-methylhydantoinase B
MIAAMPDGVYAAETFLDDDRTSDRPVPIRVKVIVQGDELTVDFSDMADQVRGPINSGYFGGGQTIARVAFKYLMGSAEMANEGTFRPIKLILPPGKIISADPTAPMGNYSTPFPTVIDAILKALEKALPTRVTGGHFGTHSGVRFHGRRPDGSALEAHDSGHGGWGAGVDHDGSGPYRTMAHGDTRIIPTELQESMLPFRIEEFSLREDSGGAGQFRGGLGFRKVYRILEACQLQTNLDRTKFPPWGVHGGAAGEPGQFSLQRVGDAQAEVIGRERSRALQPGDIFTAETGGGGGYGDPRERAVERIQKDIDRGYVTRDAAVGDYGVTIDRAGRVTR